MNFNIKHFVFISVLLFGSTLFSSDKVSNEKYINVLSEVENILEENHFKKNVTISSYEIKEKFLNSIDSQKMVFTLSNFNELSKQISLLTVPLYLSISNLFLILKLFVRTVPASPTAEKTFIGL